MTSRLLTVEQVQAIVEPHQPYTTERYRQECRACGGPVPCQTQRLADHIAAQAEQIEWLVKMLLDKTGIHTHSTVFDPFDPGCQRCLIERDMQRHGVEVATGRQA